MPDFLESVRVLFPLVLNGHLAARSGESVNGMKRALQGAVPVMLAALIISTAEDAPGRVEWGRHAHRQGPGLQGGVTGILVVLGSKDAPDSAMARGRYLLETAFAGVAPEVVGRLSQYARIRPASARTVLELVGAVLLEALHQYAATHQLEVAQVRTTLAGLQGRVRALFPTELSSLAAVLDQRAAGRKAPAGNGVAAGLPAAGRRNPAQWYKVMMVVLALVAVGMVAFGGWLPASAVQLPAPGPASGAETPATLVQDRIQPVFYLF